MSIHGFVGPRKEDTEEYINMGWWKNETLGDVLNKAAERYPEREAFVEDERRLTYAQLRETVDRLAIALLKLGINKGDCVLLQLPNWAEFIFSFFTLQKIGVPAVLLLTRHSLIEINHFSHLTNAKAWIVPEKYHNTDYLPVIDQVTKSNPQMKHIITVRGKENTGFTTYEKLLDNTVLSGEDIDKLRRCRPEADDVAFVLPTGGTTGLPKAVPRSHNSAICEAWYKAQAREQGSNDICLISVPLEHNLGLVAMNGTILTSGKLVFLDSTRPRDFCETIQREKVTCAPLVPTLLARLVNYPALDKYDMSSIRALYVGGSKTPAEVIRSVHEKIGKVYIGAFGMSEGAGCSTRLDDNEEINFNTVGKPCCPYDEFKVVDVDGRELPRNTEGELQVKGPCIFFGYLSNPEENKNAFSKDKFFITGDLAVIDNAGNIMITGRAKDIIIRGGENISPADIEALIRAHPDVEEVSVIGILDEELGERACAYIKPKGGTNITLEDIITFLKKQGASVLQLPERVELIQEIPLTNIGKPDKKALKEDYKKRHANLG